METIAVTINKGGPNPRKRTESASEFCPRGTISTSGFGPGTESASGFGPGDRIRGGTKSAGTPALTYLMILLIEEIPFP